MNKKIARIGSIIVTVTVILFAVFMFVSQFGSFFVCMFLALGYLMMIAGYHNECSDDRKVAANVGLIFGCIYAVLILLVYFAQTTAVRTDSLNEQAIMILDYSRGGLLFSYDLLGYGMIALEFWCAYFVPDHKDPNGDQHNPDEGPDEMFHFIKVMK